MGRQVFTGALTLAIALSPYAALAEEAVSRYKKVDKTGPIGFLGSYVENGIELFHDKIVEQGITTNSWGISICFFTVLVRSLVIPLTKLQLESSVRTQQLAPAREKITKAYPGKQREQIRQQLIGRVYEAANVNTLAGCLPSIVQIPVFISLYRALSNLNAEEKLEEPFLWLPSLEGPLYDKSGPEWLTSIASGEPLLGWQDTYAYLSIPFILLITQTVSFRLTTPQKSAEEMTKQEKTTQDLLNLLPLVLAGFSLNVPASLSVYWIVSNILTTSISLGIKASIGKEELPASVQTILDSIDDGTNENIFSATKMGDLEGVQKLLTVGGANPNEIDLEGRAALHYAVGLNQQPIVEALLKSGARMDVVDVKGNTPLYFAAGYGHAKMCDLLLDAGAKVTINVDGQTPADVVMANERNPLREEEHAALLSRLDGTAYVNSSAPAADEKPAQEWFGPPVSS